MAKDKTTKRTSDERAAEHQERFDGLRARALGLGFSGPTPVAIVPPYTAVTAEQIDDGDPADIVFTMPTDLEQRMYVTRLFTLMQRHIADRNHIEALANLPDMLVALSDGRTFTRLVRSIGREKDGDALLFALAVQVIEHFAGRGAADVPGGTPAS